MLLLVACGDDGIDTNIEMRCDTEDTVYLDGPDFACWLASNPQG